MNKLNITVARKDDLPAFAGFHKCKCQEKACSGDLILLNLEWIFGEYCEPDGTPVDMSTEDKKRVLIESLMHEFGHSLEEWFRIPASEEAMDKAIESYRVENADDYEAVRLSRAKSAYHRYEDVVHFKNFQGNPMPNWDELPKRIQEAWIAAAN